VYAFYKKEKHPDSEWNCEGQSDAEILAVDQRPSPIAGNDGFIRTGNSIF
jgi:hypothetical protein